MATDTDKRLAEIQARCDAATEGPWRACRDGECECKMIWAIPADAPIITIESGEWGDTFPVIEVIGTPHSCTGELTVKAKIETVGYGLIPEHFATANAKFVAHARADIPWLLDQLAAKDKEQH